MRLITIEEIRAPIAIECYKRGVPVSQKGINAFARVIADKLREAGVINDDRNPTP